MERFGEQPPKFEVKKGPAYGHIEITMTDQSGRLTKLLRERAGQDIAVDYYKGVRCRYRYDGRLAMVEFRMREFGEGVASEIGGFMPEFELALGYMIFQHEERALFINLLARSYNFVQTIGRQSNGKNGHFGETEGLLMEIGNNKKGPNTWIGYRVIEDLIYLVVGSDESKLEFGVPISINPEILLVEDLLEGKVRGMLAIIDLSVVK